MSPRHNKSDDRPMNSQKSLVLLGIGYILQQSTLVLDHESLLLDLCAKSQYFSDSSVEEDLELIRDVQSTLAEGGLDFIRDKAGRADKETILQCFFLASELHFSDYQDNPHRSQLEILGDVLGIEKSLQQSIIEVVELRARAMPSLQDRLDSTSGAFCDRFSNWQ